MAYVTYLLNPEQHTNRAGSWAGYGETREESVKNSHYHANQLPWVRTVAASQAPKWARLDARTTRELELETICVYGYDSNGVERSATEDELAEYEAYICQRR